MKKFFLISLIFIALESLTMNKEIDDVVHSLKSGSISQIVSHIQNSVEITLVDETNVYSQNQAEAVLRDFFKIHPIKDFKILHQGKNSGSNFCIGVLKTANSDYRTTIFMKQKDGRELLEEIKFEVN